MIDREFDVRAYEEGYRAGKHDAQVEIDRLRNEVSEWRKMDDEIRKFIGGKRDGRNTFDIVKERFNDAAFARSMADNLERLILKQNERLQTENDQHRIDLEEYRLDVERLRAALEPFATALKGNWSHQPDDMIIDAGFGATDLRMRFRLGDFRAARAALGG
jgi:hypothetical protein